MTRGKTKHGQGDLGRAVTVTGRLTYRTRRGRMCNPGMCSLGLCTQPSRSPPFGLDRVSAV